MLQVVTLVRHLLLSGLQPEVGSLDLLQTEKHLSEMVVGGQLYAKIDRPAGTVRFAKHPEPEQLLNSWSNNISKLLNVVNRRCAAPMNLPLCLLRVAICFNHCRQRLTVLVLSAAASKYRRSPWYIRCPLAPLHSFGNTCLI